MSRAEFIQKHQAFQKGVQRALWVLLFSLAAVAWAIPDLPVDDAKLRWTPRIIVSAMLFLVGTVVCVYLGIRNRRDFLQRCPQCNKSLFQDDAVITLASGRCGNCSCLVIDVDASCASPLNQTYSHPFRQRAWIVDGEGIHELRRGREFASIPWEEVQYVTNEEIRSVRGKRIALRLTQAKGRALRSAIIHEWQRLYPEREREHRRWLRRRADRAAYLWIPALTLTPCICFYLWFWYLGWPAYLTPQFEKLNRITTVGSVFVVCLALFYACVTRKGSSRSLQDEARRRGGR